MKHKREKLRDAERKRMAYALEAMKCESLEMQIHWKMQIIWKIGWKKKKI